MNDLYQEVVLEHNKNPRYFREIPDAGKLADGNNPLCGDALRVYVDMEGRYREGRRLQGVGVCDIEGIILGCTEIPLHVLANDTNAVLFNTTQIHAENAVDFALSGVNAAAV